MAKHSLDFDEEEEEGFSMLGREEEQASAAGNDVMSVAEFAARISLPTAIAVASKRNTGKTVMISALVRELLTTKKVTQVLTFKGGGVYEQDDGGDDGRPLIHNVGTWKVLDGNPTTFMLELAIGKTRVASRYRFTKDGALATQVMSNELAYARKADAAGPTTPQPPVTPPTAAAPPATPAAPAPTP